MFVVKVRVTLLDEVTVNADNNNDAIDKVIKKYLKDELLPSSDKYMNISFEIEEVK